MNDQEQLEQAIRTIEQYKAILGEPVANLAIQALREQLNAARSPVNGQIAQQRKQVTVLFADVSGFTAMSETMDHEEVSTVINSLWTRVDEAILAEGGRIDKHIGDAVMALFGAPLSREDDPERAVRAALRVQSELEAWKQDFSLSGSALQPQVAGLRLRIGVNTGPALIGTVGKTAEYTAIGDTVNLASRIESAAPAGGILISHTTHRHVAGLFDMAPLDAVTLKGKREAVQVYLVKGLQPRSGRGARRSVEGVRTQTVGRERELGRLQDAFGATIGRNEAHLVGIIAEAGAGKSRLLHDFTSWLEQQQPPIRFFRGRATADMASSPASLLRDVMAIAFEIHDGDRAAVARDKLERGLGGIADERGLAPAHFIGQLLGFDFSSSPHLSGILGDARQIRDLAFRSLADYLTNVSKTQPLVIILEDLQWADSASLDFIDYLLRDAPQVPLFIGYTSRAMLFEVRPEWRLPSAQRLHLDLQPLSPDDCRRLVREILQKLPEVPSALVDLIVDKAEGSPFYIEELISVLIESGVIISGEGAWSVELGKLRGLKVPETITGLLQARLDTLSVRERETLQQAAVVGRVFWPNVLERMENPDDRPDGARPALEESLGALSRKEMIGQSEASAFAGTPEFLFKNAVLHDVTYESVLLRLRRVYHLQVAEGLIRLGGERVEEYAGRVAEHYERAGDQLHSAEWYLRAGRRAQETYTPDAALTYYRKALDFYRGHRLAETRVSELELHRRLGEVLVWQARYSEAVDTYRSMLQVASESDDALGQARALLGIALCLTSQGDQHGAMDNAVRAEQLARQVSSPEETAKSLWTQGSASFRLGEGHAALALAEQALEINTGIHDRSERARCMNLIGAAYYSLGRYREAEAHMEQALALFQKLGDRRQGMDLLNNLGVIAEARGDFNAAFDRYHSALELARELGYRDGEIVFLTNQGGQQAALGNYAAAEADLISAIDIAGAAGSWILPMTYYYLSDTLLRSGRGEQALAAALKSLALSEADGARDSIGSAYRALGVISMELGRPIPVPGSKLEHSDECSAVDLFRESLQVLEQASMDGERARTLREWARFELKQGDRARGTRMWEEARAIFKQLDAQMEVERMNDLPV